MNSSIKYIPKSLSEHKYFIEHILSIIDTKLQFVEYKTSAFIKSYVKVPYSISKINGPIDVLSFDLRLSPTDNEKIFNQIEEYSKTTRLLLMMRKKLCGKTASVIYDLLSQDKYLNSEYLEIELILEEVEEGRCGGTSPWVDVGEQGRLRT